MPPSARRFPKGLGVLLLLLALAFPAAMQAQSSDPVAPVTDWLASVDEASQQIVLSWRPSADTSAVGYCICSGVPCHFYDSIYGRLDTVYRCLDHPATEPHTYRVHVFDADSNTSSLTPSFGNVVLSADVPRCSTVVTASWTPYVGMPSGVQRYRLLVRIEPFDDDYSALFTADSTGPLSHSFEIGEGATRVWLKVEAAGFGAQPLVSLSNVVSVERQTVDTAAFMDILAVEYDSIGICNTVTFDIDTAYHASCYTLWRAIDNRPPDSLASLSFSAPPFRYTDTDVNPYDSLYCYRLSVLDACGLNPRYTDWRCVDMPTPPEPDWAIPNVIIAGSDANGTFQPRLQGLKGDLYELFIYNRNGLLVFSTDDPLVGWTPSPSTPQGAYAYALRCRFNDNRIKIFTGSVLLVR